MKRSLVLFAAALTLSGCASLHRGKNPYEHRLFIEQFLDARNPLDAQIETTIIGLRANPRSATLHNQLGQLLRAKGFPKDAEVEFERAVDADPTLFSAWYNLGLVRQARLSRRAVRVPADASLSQRALRSSVSARIDGRAASQH